MAMSRVNLDCDSDKFSCPEHRQVIVSTGLEFLALLCAIGSFIHTTLTRLCGSFFVLVCGKYIMGRFNVPLAGAKQRVKEGQDLVGKNADSVKKNVQEGLNK